MFNDLMFPGNTCSSGRHGAHWQILISDRFFGPGCKKVNHWKLKGVSTFFDRSPEAEGLRWVIIHLEWTDWLINHPAFHPPNEKATDDTLSRECVYVSVMVWNEEQMTMKIHQWWPVSFFWHPCDMKPNDEFTFEFTSPNPFLPELRFPVSTVT